MDAFLVLVSSGRRRQMEGEVVVDLGVRHLPYAWIES